MLNILYDWKRVIVQQLSSQPMLKEKVLCPCTHVAYLGSHVNLCTVKQVMLIVHDKCA